MDLLSGGALVPLAIAAAVGLGLWAFLGGKKASPATTDSTTAGGLVGLLGASHKWVGIASLAMSAWSHRAAVIDVLQSAWLKLKPILYPPAATPPDSDEVVKK
jgi:predicted membrane-bound mannosyltransferase